MKLDHLSPVQLTYLEGLVTKCAAAGVDPALVIKMSQSAWEDIKGGAREAAGGAWSDIKGGIKDVGQGIVESTPLIGSELAPMKWLAGEGDIGAPGDVAAQGMHGQYLKQMRQFVNKPEAQRTPYEKALAEYYQKGMAAPEVAAAGRDKPITGMGRIGMGLQKILPWNWGRANQAMLSTGYGMRGQAEAGVRQRQELAKWQQRNPFKAPEEVPKYHKPMAIPGLSYTPYNEPYNTKGLYQQV